jgi:hypothetical protein
MDGTSGAGPVSTLLLPPLEQAARVTTVMAATRPYLSLLMGRMGFLLIALDENNQPSRRDAASLPLITQILTSPDIDRYRSVERSPVCVMENCNYR